MEALREPQRDSANTNCFITQRIKVCRSSNLFLLLSNTMIRSLQDDKLYGYFLRLFLRFAYRNNEKNRIIADTVFRLIKGRYISLRVSE